MLPVSRRSFLLGSAVAAGGFAAYARARAAGLAAGTIMDQSKVITASHWGICEAEVVGEQLVAVRPFAGDPESPSPVVQGLADLVYSPTRVRYPMVRAGFLKDGAKSDRSKRGAEPFVRVGWDQALDLVAAELKRVKEAYGNEAIHPGSLDWHSVGKLHNSPALLRRLLALHGGFTDNTGDFSVQAALVILPHVIGSTEVYTPPTAWPTVIEHSDLVVLWGCDLLKNNQIGWSPTDHYAYGAVRELKAKGTKVVSIDPRVTDSAVFLDAEWVAPRPNTDVALMLGLAHTLHAENLYDKKFIADYTAGFDKFVPYLTGEADGQPKSAEWAEKITSVPAETIKQLARRMAGGRTMVMSGWSIQRQDHGEQSYWMLMTLVAMLGQVGLPGGGVGLSYHYANGGSLAADGVAVNGPAIGDDAVKTVIPFDHGLSDALLNPGKQVDFNGERVTYPDIKLIYWAGGNPFSHQMDRNRQIEAWRKPETIIVNEPFWTATAKFADIVLPVTTTFERNDLEVASEYSGRFLVAMKQAIKPLYEARSDFEIFTGIAQRLGVADKYTDGKTEMEWLRAMYEEARTAGKAKKLDMPEFDAFWQTGFFEFPVPDSAKDYVRFSDFRDDPLLNPLGTPTGRIEIYSKNIEKMAYDDCPPHPAWLEPAEWLGGAGVAKYPLHLISPHPKFRLHSQMNNTWLRGIYEVDGREPIWLNPEDARSRGLADGDTVRIFNDRGQVLAGVVVTDRIRPGVAVLEEGAWYDPDKPGEVGALCRHGNINVLTLDKGTSKLAQGNIANTLLVQVERYVGTPPAVEAFSPPVA